MYGVNYIEIYLNFGKKAAIQKNNYPYIEIEK